MAPVSGVDRYSYRPYGELDDSSVTVANSLRYGGREFDAETGLYYQRARYYDPSLGRFVSEDPSGLAGGVNLYVYANNDPINGRDPSGLYDVKCPAGWTALKDPDRDALKCTPPTGAGSGSSGEDGSGADDLGAILGHMGFPGEVIDALDKQLQTAALNAADWAWVLVYVESDRLVGCPVSGNWYGSDYGSHVSVGAMGGGSFEMLHLRWENGFMFSQWTKHIFGYVDYLGHVRVRLYSGNDVRIPVAARITCEDGSGLVFGARPLT